MAEMRRAQQRRRRWRVAAVGSVIVVIFVILALVTSGTIFGGSNKKKTKLATKTSTTVAATTTTTVPASIDGLPVGLKPPRRTGGEQDLHQPADVDRPDHDDPGQGQRGVDRARPRQRRIPQPQRVVTPLHHVQGGAPLLPGRDQDLYGDDGHRPRDGHHHAVSEGGTRDRQQLRVPGRLSLLRRDRLPPGHHRLRGPGWRSHRYRDGRAGLHLPRRAADQHGGVHQRIGRHGERRAQHQREPVLPCRQRRREAAHHGLHRFRTDHRRPDVANAINANGTTTGTPQKIDKIVKVTITES